MPRQETTTLTVRVSGALRDFVATTVGGSGDYENVSEYLRDLIRSDKARSEEHAFQRLKAELAHAFAAPESISKLVGVQLASPAAALPATHTHYLATKLGRRI